MTAEEITTLLRICAPPGRLLLETAFLSGLRANELRNLTTHLAEARRLGALRRLLTLETAGGRNAWYEAKVHLIINGNSGSVEVFLNGTKIAALSGTRNFGTVAIGRAILGENTTGHAYNVAFDDVWISRTAS